MLSKKLLAAGFGVFSGLMLAAGSAHATDIADTLFLGDLNQWSDNSGEQIGVDDGDFVLEVGETLRGTFDIQTVENQTPPPVGQEQYGTGGVNELSGIFEIEVESVNVDFDGDGSCGGNAACDGVGQFLNGDEIVDYTFTWNDDFNTEFGLSGTTMVVFFEDDLSDPATQYDRTGTVSDAEDTATNGTKVLEIGFGGDADEFWLARDVPTDTTAATQTPLLSPLGNFSFGLSFLYNDLFAAWVQVLTGCPILPAQCADDALVDIKGQGQILGTLGSNAEYDVFNDVNLAFQPIPEPGTLGMLGVGLLGLGLFLRNRQQKRAA